MPNIEAKLTPKPGKEIAITDTERLQILKALLATYSATFTETKEADGTVVLTLDVPDGDLHEIATRNLEAAGFEDDDEEDEG